LSAKLAQVQVCRLQKHVAGIDERHRAKATDERGSKLGVQDDEAVAAGREAGRADRRVRAQPVEREAANRGVAAGKEALARGKVLHDVDDRLSVRSEDRLSVGPLAHDGTAKPVRQADARAECEHRSPRRRHAVIREALYERPDKAHF